ncbi:glycosyltransferase involved in cell wall biosynthesis [Paraburkholderia sp. MM6662-R1]
MGLEKSDLILTGYLPDDDLIVLYSECHLFVFPSFHEGFGLPVLEAMSCGAAVIGSNTSSIPEVVGRDDALFDPKSTNDIARLISRALTDEDFWRSLKEHALIQAKKYSWDQCAATTIREFEKLHAREDVVDGAGHGRVDFLENIASIKSEVRPSDNDLVGVAAAIVENEDSVCRLRAFADFGGKLKWRIEGPFDSSYSLALLNRETARAADAMGHFVVLHSTEGPGDFPANLHFLESNQDVASMHARVGDYPHESVDVVSRNLYPPRVEDMQGSLNLLHHYAWEESGFPHQWVNNFNANLNGITCLSNHVEKILIDNGVSVPMLTSGCGVDHWDRITPLAGYKVNARRFRFLHVSSCFPRKGVDLLLDAYGKAFTSDDDVSLVIKTFDNPHNEVYQWLAERKAQNVKFPDVQIIVNDINDSELKALYQECHVLVAPSKAEGFGLPMAEAMLSGLPVITTAWGGQLDFCNESNAWLVDYEFERAQTHFGLFASVWARVKVDELANVLTQAYNSPQAHLTEKALAGRRQLLKNFKWTDVVGRAVKAAQVWGCTQEHSTDVKIGWISTWNTKCGVATYSEHFLKNMDKANLTVLAPFADVDDSLKSDDVACIRCWNQGKEANNFDEIARCIREIAVNTVVVQFNYGFFNFSEFRDFLERQLDDGRVVIVIMHSTSDPFGVCENWQLSELQTAFARCQRILVHSVQDLNRLKAMGLVENVALFPHGVLDCQMAAPVAEKQLPTIASYGFCLPHKGLIELVQAIALLKEGGEFVRLKMVNAEYPDPVSSKLVNEIGALIKKLGVSDIIEMHTDFLADEESFSLLADANLLVFPYQQTGESASGAVRYGLAAKRPIVVSPLAIFDDIGGAAFRFSGTTAKDIAHGISTTLRELSENSVKAQGVEADAKQWREQHDYAVISKRLFNICQALVRKEFPRTSRFLGSSPRLSTVVGGIQGRSVVTTGVAGNLVHGPYLAMAAGKHQVTIRGAVGAGGLAEASVDVAVDQGRLVLGESVLGQVNDDCLASLVISLERAYDDLEVRVWVGESSELSISAVEIAPWLGEHEMGTVESKGMADRYRAFQDIAIDSKDADRRMKVGSPKSRLAEPEQRLMEIESSY